ncbi:hypothetical protein CEUSTIGMA_g10729.t1, partial [Chlamydomonas eustigma]
MEARLAGYSDFDRVEAAVDARIAQTFGNRLIIIDEAHNLRDARLGADAKPITDALVVDKNLPPLVLSTLIGAQKQAVSNQESITDARGSIFFYPPDGLLRDVLDTVLKNGKRRLRIANTKVFQEGLHEHGAKLLTILSILEKSAGKTFIHSEFVDHGLIPLAVVLELNGFKRFGGSPLLLESTNGEPTNGYYALLTGQSDVSNDLHSTLQEFNSPKSVIRVLLGSDILSEGVDLKGVRH